MRRWRSVIAMVFAACAFGCTGESADDGTTVLRIALMGPELEAYKSWKRTFETEHPNVRIETQFIAYDQGPTVYNAMIEGDNLPDLGFLFMGLIAEYAERNVLESLDVHMSPEERDAWVPIALSAGAYRGTTYAVPIVGGNRTLYVREDWMKEAGFQEPPNTWEQVRDLARKMNQPPERYGMCIGAGRQKHLMQEQISMMWGFGADFFDEDGRLAINSSEAVDYVSFLGAMHTVDHAMPPGILTLNANECYAEMAAGKVGMVFSSVWQPRMCEDAGIKDCIPLDIPGGKNRKMLMIVDLLSIFKTSKHKDLAYDFIRMTQRPENRVLIDAEVGGVPVTRVVADHPHYEIPSIRVFQAHRDLLKLTPKHPEWTRIQDGWGEAIQMVLSGGGTAREALDGIQARLLRELEDPSLP
jgi:multiple sugar transport system substrate-binding protein